MLLNHHIKNPDKIINEPKNIPPPEKLKITATPKDLPNISDVSQKKAGFVEALESDVIASGLIKEKIIIQTEEEKTVKVLPLKEHEVEQDKIQE